LIGLDLDQNGLFAGVIAIADLIQTIYGSTAAPVSYFRLCDRSKSSLSIAAKFAQPCRF